MERSWSPSGGLLVCKRVLDVVAQAARAVGAVSSFVFITILFIQVMFRYLFNSPIYGIEETVIALMVWYSALGAAVVYWEKGHASIVYFLKFMPQVVQIAIRHLSNLIVLATSAVYVYGGIGLFRIQLNTMPVGGLPFARAYYYGLPMIIMGILLVLFSAYDTVEFIVMPKEVYLQEIKEEEGGVIE